jgi:uncharacterized protein YaaW (UPF0174 family)
VSVDVVANPDVAVAVVMTTMVMSAVSDDAVNVEVVVAVEVADNLLGIGVIGFVIGEAVMTTMVLSVVAGPVTAVVTMLHAVVIVESLPLATDVVASGKA